MSNTQYAIEHAEEFLLTPQADGIMPLCSASTFKGKIVPENTKTI